MHSPLQSVEMKDGIRGRRTEACRCLVYIIQQEKNLGFMPRHGVLELHQTFWFSRGRACSGGIRPAGKASKACLPAQAIFQLQAASSFAITPHFTTPHHI